MKKQEGYKKNGSLTLRRWYMLTTSVLFLLLMIVMLVVSSYIGSALRKQAIAYNDDLLSFYLEKIETNIKSMERYLNTYPSSNYDVSTLALSKNLPDRYVAADNIISDLGRNVMVYDNFDGLFVYSTNPIQDVFLSKTGSNATSSQVMKIQSMVGHDDGNNVQYKKWGLYEFNESHFFMRIVKIGSTYCGAWVSAQSLMTPLDKIDFAHEGIAIFSDENGMVITNTKRDGSFSVITPSNNEKLVAINGTNYLQISKVSQIIPITLSVLIPDSIFVKKIRGIQMAVIAVFVVALCIIPVFGYFINWLVYQPIGKLIDAMQKVAAGNLSIIVHDDSPIREMNKVIGHFNNMVSQIKRLEEDVYQRKIIEQKTQLDYLQLQIKPHFFLNSLNVIYSFSLVKRFDLIEKMVICLVKYFRYMFQSTILFVPLQAETEHVENYMEIQAIRYPGNFFYQKQIDDNLMQTPLPPLLIQTFIENSIKYALDIEKTNSILLTVQKFRQQGCEYMHIMIADNGAGYPKMVLEKMEMDLPLGEDVTQNIGIQNAKQRLKLMYGEKAKINLHNEEKGGAVTEIFIPIIIQEEEKG